MASPTDSNPRCRIESPSSPLYTIAYLVSPNATNRMDTGSPDSLNREGVLRCARRFDRFSGTNVTVALPSKARPLGLGVSPALSSCTRFPLCACGRAKSTMRRNRASCARAGMPTDHLSSKKWEGAPCLEMLLPLVSRRRFPLCACGQELYCRHSVPSGLPKSKKFRREVPEGQGRLEDCSTATATQEE